MQVVPAYVATTRPAGKIHNHIKTFSLDIQSFSYLDNGELCSGNIQSINISGQTGECLLCSVRSMNGIISKSFIREEQVKCTG